MALWKLAKRFVLPVGAVVSVPFVVPLMYASPPPDPSKLVKPQDLPLYDKIAPQSTQNIVEKEPSAILQTVTSVRKGIFTGLATLSDGKESAVHYYEVGKAHSQNAYNYLVAEENVVPRAAAITFGGLTGFLFALRRGVFKKMMYTSGGIIGMSFVCYPKQATQVSEDLFKIGKYYAWLAYNKYQESGSKEKLSPQSSLPPLPAEPPKKSGPIQPDSTFVDKITEQVSDVHYWGFRLRGLQYDESRDTEEPNSSLWSKSMVPVARPRENERRK